MSNGVRRRRGVRPVAMRTPQRQRHVLTRRRRRAGRGSVEHGADAASFLLPVLDWLTSSRPPAPGRRRENPSLSQAGEGRASRSRRTDQAIRCRQRATTSRAGPAGRRRGSARTVTCWRSNDARGQACPSPVFVESARVPLTSRSGRRADQRPWRTWPSAKFLIEVADPEDLVECRRPVPRSRRAAPARPCEGVDEDRVDPCREDGRHARRAGAAGRRSTMKPETRGEREDRPGSRRGPVRPRRRSAPGEDQPAAAPRRRTAGRRGSRGDARARRRRGARRRSGGYRHHGPTEAREGRGADRRSRGGECRDQGDAGAGRVESAWGSSPDT